MKELVGSGVTGPAVLDLPASGIPVPIQTELDRARNNGGTVEDGIGEDLLGPIYETLDAAGQWSNVVFLGAAGVREVVSGSVATIFDASGNQNDATQGTSSKRPTDATAASFGGNVVSDFDGSDDEVPTAILSAHAQPFSVISVAQCPTDTGDGNTIIDGVDGTNRCELVNVRFNKPDRGINFGNFYTVSGATTSAHYWSAVADGVNSDVWQSGSKILSSTDLGSDDFTGLNIGSNNPAGGLNYADMLHALTLIVSADFRGTLRSDLERIISDYYTL